MSQAASAPSASAQPVPAPPLPRWHGDGLPSRSIRFTLLLMAPLAAGLVVRPGAWAAYALLTSILAFLLDTGGPALGRLAAIATAGVVVLSGAALGTLAAGNLALTALVLALGATVYALVEGIHTTAAFAARFLCLTASIGALYAPIHAAYVPLVAGFVLVAWLVSVAWDMATGLWRPSTAPRLRDIVARLEETRRERWIFAAVVSAAVVAAFLSAKAFGLAYPNWAVLAVVIVLRADSTLSRRMLANLMLGTILGVCAAYAWEAVFTAPLGLLAGMVLAALLRWPLQKVQATLGLAAMAAFVVLLMQLVAVETGALAPHAALDRLLDIALGCGFAVLALWVNQKLQGALRLAP